MATLRDLRNRIKGIRNTQQITKAMKMVAAAKLRRAQDNVINARPYAAKLRSLVSDLITEEDIALNSLLVERPVKSVLVVCLTSDRGLCGAFNTNIVKETNRVIADLESQGITPKLMCIGKKGHDNFKKEKYTIVNHYTGIFNSLSFSYVTPIMKSIIEGFDKGDYDKVIVVYNEFKSVIQQRIVSEQLLPVKIEKSESGADEQFIYEPGEREIVNYLIPRNVESQVWRMLLESNASEFGARMTAMENATSNASDLIRTLRIKYNKERQAAITKEILEVVSGANALKG